MKPTKTSIEQMFGPLADLTMENTAYQVAARRFDFGLDSAVCRHLVLKTFAAIEAEERRQGIQRVRPFTLRVDWRGLLIPVSLLDRDITKPLLAGTPFAQVLRDRREHLFRELLEGDPSVTMDDVRRLLAPIERLARARRRSAQTDSVARADDCRMDLAVLRKTLLVPATLVPMPEQLPPPPAPVVALVGPVIEREGRSPELARSFISHLVALRQRFCPKLDDLAPGQLVAIALDVRDRRMSLKTRYRAHVPVRLTLYHDAELAALERLGPRDHQQVDELLGRRLARILTESYCQGGLISLVMAGFLTHISPSRVSKFVNRFEANTRLVLPTPGTIHDAGSKLTHKASIVRLHLDGLDCKQIARETFHCEDAVGRYVDDFERVLIAQAHGLPTALVPRLLKLGAHVVTQYEALIAEHIGGLDDVRSLLTRRGIQLQEAAS